VAINRNKEDSAAIDEIVQAIARAHQSTDSIIRDVLGEVAPGVTKVEFTILLSLAADGLQRITDLTFALSMAPSSMTRYCDHLHRLGLITREREFKDRREVRVDLTTEGRQLVETVTARREVELLERLSEVNPALRRQLLRALKSITRDLAPPEQHWQRPITKAGAG
jgi:DNA-binding MarR family transcriptional regulator